MPENEKLELAFNILKDHSAGLISWAEALMTLSDLGFSAVDVNGGEYVLMMRVDVYERED